MVFITRQEISEPPLAHLKCDLSLVVAVAKGSASSSSKRAVEGHCASEDKANTCTERVELTEEGQGHVRQEVVWDTCCGLEALGDDAGLPLAQLPSVRGGRESR